MVKNTGLEGNETEYYSKTFAENWKRWTKEDYKKYQHWIDWQQVGFELADPDDGYGIVYKFLPAIQDHGCSDSIMGEVFSCFVFTLDEAEKIRRRIIKLCKHPLAGVLTPKYAEPQIEFAHKDDRKGKSYYKIVLK